MQDTNLFDDDAKAVALMNMASAAAHADRKLAQAFVDAGLMQVVARFVASEAVCGSGS